MVYALPPLAAQSGVRYSGCGCGICDCKAEVGQWTACPVELPRTSLRGRTGFTRSGRLSMASPLSRTLLFVFPIRLAWRVGPERVAERGNHSGAVIDHAVAGVAPRILTARDDLHKSRRLAGQGSSPTLSGEGRIYGRTHL